MTGVMVAGVLVVVGCPGARSGAAPGEVAGVAARVDADPLAGVGWRPEVDYQQCAPLEPVVAAADAVVDSASLVRAAMGAPDGYVLWTTSFDGNGMPAQARVLESQLPREVQGTLTESLVLRPQEGTAYLRLRLDVARVHADSTPRVALRLGGAQYCEPALLNIESIRFALGAANREGTVELRLYIDQQGVVQERQVLTSSGDETTDRVALGVVGGMQYSPAYLERLPVPSWLRYRVQFE